MILISAAVILVALGFYSVYHISKKQEKIEFIWVGAGDNPVKHLKN